MKYFLLGLLVVFLARNVYCLERALEESFDLKATNHQNQVKLAGTINCQGVNCPKVIPPGSVAKLLITNGQVMDAPSILIAEKQLTDLQQFPIPFEIEYDHEKTAQYGLEVRISNDQARLTFITDTHFSVVNQDSNEPLNKIDIHVIPIDQV
jgi:uncharacterized lipoprotein YbaY